MCSRSDDRTVHVDIQTPSPTDDGPGTEVTPESYRHVLVAQGDEAVETFGAGYGDIEDNVVTDSAGIFEVSQADADPAPIVVESHADFVDALHTAPSGSWIQLRGSVDPTAPMVFGSEVDGAGSDADDFGYVEVWDRESANIVGSFVDTAQALACIRDMGAPTGMSITWKAPDGQTVGRADYDELAAIISAHLVEASSRAGDPGPIPTTGDRPRGPGLLRRLICFVTGHRFVDQRCARCGAIEHYR